MAGVLLVTVLGAIFCWAPATAQAQRRGGAGDQPAGVAPIPVYRLHCARCHGDTGNGDGPFAPYLNPPPADFSRGRFKLKTTIPGTPPTVANVTRTIRVGMPGTAMPAFGEILTDDEIEALVAYLFTLAGRTPSRRSLRVATVPDLGADGVVQGKRLYGRLGCAECHGAGGRGDGPLTPSLENDDGTPVIITDLTRPWAFKGGWDRIDIALRILAGMEGTPHPGHYHDQLRADQLYSLVDYVLSLRRAPDLARSALQDAQREPGAGESVRQRGERLTASLACARCHTPFDEQGDPIDALRMAGGLRIDLDPLRTSVASNLTPHSTGLGGVDLDTFKRMMREGRAKDGRRLDPITMPWPHYAELSDGDLEAIHAYLISLPPIANEIPPTRSSEGLSTLLFKVRAMRGDRTATLVFHPGNAGDGTGTAPKGPAIGDRTWVKVAIALVIILGIEILYLWRPFATSSSLRRRRRRQRKTVRERVRGPLIVVSLALAAGIVVVAWWPPGRFGSPAKTMEMLAPQLPVPESASGDLVPIAERGRYLTGVAACATCHSSVDPVWPMDRGPALGGGARFAWSVFGELPASNLRVASGDSAEEDRRRFWTVMRSGLAGRRPVHPAAMPWGLHGRFTDEELEAIWTYLRTIPAVEHELPPPRPQHGGELLTVELAPEGTDADR